MNGGAGERSHPDRGEEHREPEGERRRRRPPTGNEQGEDPALDGEADVSEGDVGLGHRRGGASARPV